MNRVKHTIEFTVAQPVSRVFPLFSPEGERLWVPGWEYESMMGTNDLHENYVFLTKNHDHASTDAIWLVKRYEPGSYLVEFYKIEPGDKVGVITVQCIGSSEEESRIQVSYEYIGLTEKGRAFVATFTREAYENFISEWKELLAKHFEKSSGLFLR